MGGHDLDDLLFLGPVRLEEAGNGKMASLAFFLGECLVRHFSHQSLEESVLTQLGRSRVAVDPEELLARQRGEQLTQL